MLTKPALSVVVLLAAISGYYFGQDVPMTEQLPIYEGLRNTSAIIFGVMGAWLAILHPSSLKKIFSKEGGSISKDDRATINLLLSPIIISTFILLIVLVVPLLVAASRNIPILVQYSPIFRGISFSVMAVLTILQIWTLILTLVPSDILKRILQKEEAKENLKKGMFSGTRKNNK
jgi:hypothetical protein